MKRKRLLSALAASLMLMLFVCPCVAAADVPTLSFTDNGSGSTPMQYDPSGEPGRFINLSDMRPGSSYTSELQIKNHCRSRSFALYLRADIQTVTQNSQLAMELLDSIEMVIHNSAGKLIYKGPASGLLEAGYPVEQIKNNNGVLFIPLGTYRAGERDSLTVVSSLSPKFGRKDMSANEYYPGATAYVDWTFWVTGDDRPPPTSETTSQPTSYPSTSYPSASYPDVSRPTASTPTTITIDEEETPLTIIEDELIPLSPAPQMGVLDTIELGAIILMLATAGLLLVFLWLYRRKRTKT